jgi:hypothetical protein
MLSNYKGIQDKNMRQKNSGIRDRVVIDLITSSHLTHFIETETRFGYVTQIIIGWACFITVFFLRQPLYAY